MPRCTRRSIEGASKVAGRTCAFLKAMELGPDGIALSIGAIQAVGYIAARICNTNPCATGVATPVSALQVAGTPG